jgi:hypothetical protein
VSGLNVCGYCHGVHAATAQAFGVSEGTLAALLADVDFAPVAGQLKPLLRYAGKLTVEYGLGIRELMRVPRIRPRSSAGVGTGGHDPLDV